MVDYFIITIAINLKAETILTESLDPVCGGGAITLPPLSASFCVGRLTGRLHHHNKTGRIPNKIP